jgi:hypothetical protein
VPHLDPDRLVLLAFAEEPADDTETAHLAVCAGCRDEIGSLREVTRLGAETQDLRDLPPPPAAVWAGIKAETTADVRRIPVPHRKRRAWLMPAVAAGLALIAGVAGTVVAFRIAQRPPAVVAAATLQPLATAPPDARGNAEVLGDEDLRVAAQRLPLTTGYYEVWLIDPDDLTKMVSLGSLTAAADVTLPIPPGTDLNRFRLVDISAEANDGDSAHSGDSLLRGTLAN